MSNFTNYDVAEMARADERRKIHDKLQAEYKRDAQHWFFVGFQVGGFVGVILMIVLAALGVGK